MVEQRTENPRVTGSIPVLGILYWKMQNDKRNVPSLPEAPVTRVHFFLSGTVYALLRQIQNNVIQTVFDGFAETDHLIVCRQKVRHHNRA